MPDAFAYCTELVREADHPRSVATLFAPTEHRAALAALYAFNLEITRVPGLVREPLAGEIRLQWWADVLGGERDGEANAMPVAAALMATVTRYRLDTKLLRDLVEARRFDLYDEPMAEISDLESYLAETSSALIAVATKILGADASSAAASAGIAQGITEMLRTLPLRGPRHALYFPSELMARHGTAHEDITARRHSAGLTAAFAELRSIARRHLATARACLLSAQPQAVPAFQPLSLAGPVLDGLDRVDPFALVEIGPLRQSWLIWRAARDPARIAG